MARPKTPTSILDAKGAYKKNPSRKQSGEPKPRMGIGSAPTVTNASVEFASVWDEVVGMVCPGVLGNSDRIALEAMCHLLIQFRLDPLDFPATKLSRLEALLGKFGMTPADRAKIKISDDDEPEKPEDQYF